MKKLQRKKREAWAASGELTHEELTAQASQDTRTLLLRILGPVTKFVDKPWKVQPIFPEKPLHFLFAPSLNLTV